MRINLILFIFSFLILSCREKQELIYSNISGQTMGTTYHIIMQGPDRQGLKKKIDNLLVKINNGVSTYESNSVISLFNQNYEAYLAHAEKEENEYFLDNFSLSKEVFAKTNGAFEPTIMPIVNYWGFGYEEKNQISEVDSSRIDSLMDDVGFEKLLIKEDKVYKKNQSVQLDFSAIAKGYGVDKVSEFLDNQGIENYYVEIGGEVFARGVNDSGLEWRTGISVPSSEADVSEFQKIVNISNQGIATSGNYRNFYEIDGKIRSHTINPKTGYPEINTLLSATVIAPSCALADGFATACMVLGLEKSIEMINLYEEIEAILIYTDENQTFQVFDSYKN